MKVNFYFDIGGSGDAPVVVYTPPSAESKGLSPDDVARAFERIIAHLKSVGYNVAVEELRPRAKK